MHIFTKSANFADMNGNLHNSIVFDCDFHRINSPAYYDCIVHLICTSGEGAFTYNGTRFAIGINEIAVISNPQAVTEIESDSNFKCEYVIAPDKFLHTLLPANNYSIAGCVSLYSNPIIKVSASDAVTFISDLRNVSARIKDVDHPFYAEMIGGLLQTMIYDLFAFHSMTNENILSTDRVGYITRQFFNLIESGRPKTEREVSYYAEQLSVTPKYLSDTIKRISGKSVSTHINRAAASIIKNFLNDSGLSITQIADEMKFTSVSYFSRYCVKHLGMSPSEYRTVNSSES